MQTAKTTSMPNNSKSYQDEGFGALFGYPISHSLAPFVHQLVFDSLGLQWNFSLFESKDMDQFLKMIKDPRCYGSNLQQARI
jgi:quinate dehydrogenase